MTPAQIEKAADAFQKRAHRRADQVQRLINNLHDELFRVEDRLDDHVNDVEDDVQAIHDALDRGHIKTAIRLLSKL